MKRIRKGDNVVVVSGKHKGSKGTVLAVLDNERVVVEGVNRVKRHVKGNPNRPKKAGGIVDRDAPLHVSKVALFNPSAKKGDRVGIKKLADGKRVRFFKSNGEMVEA
jgi:large subunit ribosomal protein L24